MESSLYDYGPSKTPEEKEIKKCATKERRFDF